MKKTEKIILVVLLCIIVALAGLIIADELGDGSPASSSESAAGSSSIPSTEKPAPATPTPEPVWFEQAKPAEKAEYVPPEGVKYPYYVKVNRALCTVTIYGIDANGEYSIPVKAFPCSVGREGHETITGTYEMPESFYWMIPMVDGTYSQYAYRIKKGTGYMFHSVPCFENKKNTLETVEFNKLGEPASLGCVRLTVADAKWLYDNCPVGTTTEIFDDFESPGPLGKPDTIKIPLDHAWAGWDPTDPDPKNPWLDVSATIEASNITVECGKSVDIMSGVKAYDTCGNDISNKIIWYGKYTFDIPGVYNVTFAVTDAIGSYAEKTVFITVFDFENPNADYSAPVSVNIDKSSVKSDNALLVCLNNNAVLFDKNASQKAYPASITKAMTVLVALEQFDNFDKTFVITQKTYDDLAAQDASMAKLPIGVEITVSDLIYGTFMPSGAEAAVTLAIGACGSEAAFVDLMNKKAQELGMKNTHFTNVTGLHHDDQYTTCEDIAILLKAALKNDTFKKIFTAKSYTTRTYSQYPNGITYKSTMFNFLDGKQPDNGITIQGGKTGYTSDAGLCLASYSVSTDSPNEYILITMDSPGNYWEFDPPNHVADALYIYGSISEI